MLRIMENRWMKQLKVENLREIKETEEKPAQLEHRDQQDQLVQ